MIIVADPHWGNQSGGIPTIKYGYPDVTRTEDVYNRMVEATDVAAKLGEPLIVAGDISHVPNPLNRYETWIFDWLRYARSRKVQVFIIPGNHDATQMWVNTNVFAAADLPNVVAVCTPSTLVVEDRYVGFYPHLTRKDLSECEERSGSYSEDFIEQFSTSFNGLLIGHAMVVDSRYDNEVFYESGDAMTIDGSLMPGLKLAVLGHIHGYARYVSPVTNAVMVYPGSVTTNNFGELDEPKGYIRVPPDTFEVEHHEWETPETDYLQLDIDLYSKDSFDESVVQEMCAGAAVKIRVQAREFAQIDERRIRQLVNEVGYLAKFESQIIRNDDGEREQLVEVANFNHNHPKLLEAWLKRKTLDPELEKRCLSLGKGIIAEGLNDEG